MALRHIVSFFLASLLFNGVVFAGPLCKQISLFDLRSTTLASGYHPLFLSAEASISSTEEFGIREDVRREYRQRYAEWKKDLLQTEFGRAIWTRYADSKNFLLTITVHADMKHGAETHDYKWDRDGNLVAATITLGKELDKGFPDPVYYPVMNSLSAPHLPFGIDGDIVASTKLAHELGHVEFTAKANSKQFQDQDRLMAAYYKIFLSNGYNTKDERLVSLTNQLGTEPIRIWEDREYSSEVSALNHLVERIDKESFFCPVLAKIKRNVRDHARGYMDRFAQIDGSGGRAMCSE